MTKVDQIIRDFLELPETERVALASTLAASTKSKKVVGNGRCLTINQVAAASSEHEPLLRNITASARRLGFDIDPSKPISTVEMDKALRGADPVARMSLKSTMAKLALIP